MNSNYSRQNVENLTHTLQSRTQKRERKVGLGILQIVLICLIAGVIIVLCAGIGAFRSIIDTAPDIGNIDVTPTGYSTFVYDREGNQTAKLVSTDSNRIPVTLDMVPEDLQHAFVAIEDERFYEHNGIDITGILRAAVKGITTGNFSEGASTITQQLIKNNVFTDWTSETKTESIKRKIQEQYLAIELEKTMSKDDILLNYMNTINLGHNTLGVQAASLRYFGKSVSDLTLSECAVIAGITQNPTRYDPIEYPENNAERRKVVLGNMLDQGYITQDEYDEAMADDVYSRIQVIDSETDDEDINSYFVDALTNQVLEDLENNGYTETQAYTLLYSGGLNIYSTQDPEIQKIADDYCSNEDNYPADTHYLLDYRLSVRNSEGTLTNYSSEMLLEWMKENGLGSSLEFNSKEEAEAMADQYKEAVVGTGDTVSGESLNITPQPQISMTIEDQHTGEIVAMVGGRGEKTANRVLNRATDTMRQPGSTFKIVSTYAPALDAAGLTLATVQDDAPYTYPDGTQVRNWYGEAYRGLSSLRLGIQESMNIVTVKTLEQITPQLGYQYLLDFGFTTLVDNEVIDGQTYSDVRLTLALGGITKGVKNIELNAAYACIANGGLYIKPKLYTMITDHDGNVIIDNSGIDSTNSHRVLKETTAWLLTSAMEDVVTKGTGTSVNFGTTKIAGKTGTTSDYNDEWFAGYTPEYCATVWTGYDDNTKLFTSEQRALARTVWRGVMEQIPANQTYEDFTMPDGIVQKTICTSSGLLPVAGLCDATLGTEYFAEDTVPTETCNVHYSGMICAYSGLPAADACPFAYQGVLTVDPSNVGQKCEHTAEFMASDEGKLIVQQEEAEMEQRNATAAAQSSLDQANTILQQAAQALSDAQNALASAQQTGDQAQIAAAQAQVDQATVNYQNATVNQQQAAAAAAAAQTGGTTGTTGDTTAGGDASAGTGQQNAGQTAQQDQQPQQ